MRALTKNNTGQGRCCALFGSPFVGLLLFFVPVGGVPVSPVWLARRILDFESFCGKMASSAIRAGRATAFLLFTRYAGPLAS